MSRPSHHSTAELWVKLSIALLDFGAILMFAWIHVTTPKTVPYWLFALFITILGTMLSVDILRDVREQG